MVFLFLLSFCSCFCRCFLFSIKSEGKQKKEGRKRVNKEKKEKGISLYTSYIMSSWFSSDSESSEEIVSSSEPGSDFGDQYKASSSSVVVVPDYSCPDRCPNFFLEPGRGQSEDPSWYERPEVVAGGASLAGALVLLLVVVLSIRYRHR